MKQPLPSTPPSEHAMRPTGGDDARVLDEILVLRIQAGDRSALDALVVRWQERLWRHALRLTGNRETAWDVVQESWMRVLRGIERLRDPGSFRAWAFTIVTHTATDRLRGGHAPLERAGTGDDEANLDALPAFVNETDERREAVDQLRAALSELPRDTQSLLSLRYLEQLEHWELAQVLGVPEGTVRSRLHTARRRLKTILERMQR